MTTRNRNIRMGGHRFKGAVLKSHVNPPESEKETIKFDDQNIPISTSPYRPGRRYPADLLKMMSLLEMLHSKKLLHKDEGLDGSRLSRFVEPHWWQMWTTEGRRVEIKTTGIKESLEDATVSVDADPDIPPVAR